YFHNWTGNRVTCHDWFQQSLKEGLTVFRDQNRSSRFEPPDSNHQRCLMLNAVDVAVVSLKVGKMLMLLSFW
ncbi:hypothetical protein SOVF_160960 isoform B, partial [Spinacia oleracea]